MIIELLVFISITFIFFKGFDCVADRIEDETIFLELKNDDQQHETVLDCDYNINDTTSFLTVKWFKNNKTVYQWIRGSLPTAIVRTFISDHTLSIQKIQYI